MGYLRRGVYRYLRLVGKAHCRHQYHKEKTGKFGFRHRNRIFGAVLCLFGAAVLLVHGEKAHSCYFSRDTYESMTKNSRYADNKELVLIPGAVHTDLYDKTDMIPFEKMEGFFRKYLDS